MCTLYQSFDIEAAAWLYALHREAELERPAA